MEPTKHLMCWDVGDPILTGTYEEDLSESLGKLAIKNKKLSKDQGGTQQGKGTCYQAYM